MIKDAEANKESDQKKRALVDAKNQAESLVHSTTKSLDEYGDKIDAETKDSISKAKDELVEAAKGDNVDDINSKIEALAKAAQKLGEEIYKAQQAEQQTTSENSNQQDNKEEDIVDAEYEEVDKK